MLARRTFRQFKNGAFLALSLVATLTGLACLAAILWTLISHGVAGLSWHLFTAMTPPPGAEGGLLNALYGSAVMTLIGILIGSPIGVLAGTYLAEYGQKSLLSTIVRFINDVLLSAPSIIIGLFVYQIVVVKMGHFSAIAGALSLAVLAIPVTLRTTEDMLNLVPPGMKDASAALGAYPWRTVLSVLYPAARSASRPAYTCEAARSAPRNARRYWRRSPGRVSDLPPMASDRPRSRVSRLTTGTSSGGGGGRCTAKYSAIWLR